MENKNIILVLAAVIVVLAVVAGVMFSQINEKNTANIEINQTNTTNDTEVAKTESVEKVETVDYPKHSPIFGDYRLIERQYELAVIETSGGEYYVLAGDGYYTYGGHDPYGNIKLGSYVGKY